MAAQDDSKAQQEHAYVKAVKSIQSTLEKPQDFLEAFVIEQIIKIGECYSSLVAEVKKWGRLGNTLKQNTKNQELGIYVSGLKSQHMYSTLSKLLSPTIGHTTSIQTAACKTLSIISHRPNQYRDAEWYDKKQRLIALTTLNINGSEYNTLLLLSHILSDNSLKNLNLKCHALQLIGNLVNHNSSVTIEINKNFRFISIILKLLNDNELFELTLKREKKNNISLMTLLNGVTTMLNIIQHNETLKIEFSNLNGWVLICKCLLHPCIQIRELALCFINIICVNSKLCSKYLLNTKYNEIESFKLLLNLMDNICNNIGNDIENKCDLDRTKYKHIDNILCRLICVLSSLCNNNMIGNRKFCVFKSWGNIFKLLQTINNLNNKLNYTFSDELHFQIFSLFCCFEIPPKDKWKLMQYDPMFKNDINEINNNQNKQSNKKLTMKQRKLKQKQDELKESDEYKKTQRIIKQNIRMLGGYKEIKGQEQNDEDDDIKMNENESDIYDRDIVFKYLFECLGQKRFVVGVLNALGKLCKIKYNGNINRLDAVIGEYQTKNNKTYQESLAGMKERMRQNFMKCNFPCGKGGAKGLNELIYFINAVNDIFDVIAIDGEEKNKNKKEKKDVIQSRNVRDLFLDSQIFYVFCMVITNSYRNYFDDENTCIKFEKEIIDLQLNACCGLGKVIKYDGKCQKRLSKWIPRIHAMLRELATNMVDTSISQMGLAHVICAGCFTPENPENIKLVEDKQIDYILNQLFNETRVTATSH